MYHHITMLHFLHFIYDGLQSNIRNYGYLHVKEQKKRKNIDGDQGFIQVMQHVLLKAMEDYASFFVHSRYQIPFWR